MASNTTDKFRTGTLPGNNPFAQTTFPPGTINNIPTISSDTRSMPASTTFIGNIDNYQSNLLNYCDDALNGRSVENLKRLIGTQPQCNETSILSKIHAELVEIMDNPDGIVSEDSSDSAATSSPSVNGTSVASPKYKATRESKRISNITVNSNDANVKRFTENFKKYAIYIQKKCGIDARIPLSIIAIEGGWGKHTPIMLSAKPGVPYAQRTINSYNMFNIKTTDEWKKKGGSWAYGQDETPREQFRVYKNYYESCDDWMRVMHGSLYINLVQKYSMVPGTFLYEMYKTYATSKDAPETARTVSKYFNKIV